MKKILFSLILILTFSSVQSQINGYKYVNINIPVYDDGEDIYNLVPNYEEDFKDNGLIPIKNNQVRDVVKKGKYCQILTVDIDHRKKGRWQSQVTLTFTNCLGEEVYKGVAAAGNDMSGTTRDLQRAGERIIDKVTSNYKFMENMTPSLPDFSFDLSKYNIDEINIKAFRDFYDKNGVDHIEGIWGMTQAKDDLDYKLGIIYNEDTFKYDFIIIESSNVLWMGGEIKGNAETAASEEILTLNWYGYDKRPENIKKVIATAENSNIIKFNLGEGDDISENMLYRIYPKLDSKKSSNSRKKSGSWEGNGSGIIISKSGFIVTNHHVIEDADEIEVEFILNEEIQKFNAELVQVDKVNDLAIIKIFDMNFDGVDEPPYNFKTRTSDVGTKVYAFGYPMALTAMGKEIKITDGIISSKSGFDGDITTYQITAPIQGGNSGGPLFDEKGNLLGINSSGIRKDLADNVGYTIKSSYVLNLIDVMPKSIDLPSNTKLESLPLTEQIKEISKYVVLIKVK
tara:strand:+ start:786 stop:2321 length:1536 start_codon:yes stop_codon:yes gene_type:complete